mgnify:CR=1 FL=1
MFRRWNPFKELDAIRKEVDRVFDGYFPQGNKHLYSAFLPGSCARSYPLLNVTENSEEYTVEALAPGLDVETIEVTVKEKTLTLSGEKKGLSDVENDKYHRNERSTGRFTRTLTVETEIDADKVAARYTNGLLIITLPKAESAKPKSIEVKVS